MPVGQSGHVLSMQYGDYHRNWSDRETRPLTAGRAESSFTLAPNEQPGKDTMMIKRRVGIGLLILPLLMIGRAPAQEAPDIPSELKQEYGPFAAVMVNGGAGVYSNDWERPSDGTPMQSAERFSCTRVLGFSQSMEWYAGLSVTDQRDEGTRPDLSALAPDAFLSGWQGRFFVGAAIGKWTDPDFRGWSGAHRRVHETPAHCGRDEVDRVVFNVSGAARSPDAWAAAVDSVADLIRSKFSAVRRIVMQPLVGAPEGECTDVRAARNHPVIVQDIRRAADRGGVTAGPSPGVASCDQFSDDLGHLTVEGAEHVRRILREHYRSSTAGPDRSDLPRELIVHTTLRPPNQDIYLVGKSGTEPQRVTNHPALDYDATFSSDGRWLVFTSDRSGNPDLYALNLEEGGEPVRLTRHPAMDDAADISPDGEQLVFVSTREGSADVFVMPFAPGDTTAEARAENLTDSPADDFNPAFSPDGTRIAWARRTGPVRPPDLLLMETFVMESDGSEPRPVVGREMIAGGPAWSDDGEALYVHGIFHGGAMERLRRRHGEGWTSRIWRVALSGGEPEPVTVADTFLALSPAMTPDGRVAFFRGRRPPSREAPLYRRTGAVHTVDPDGSDPRPAYEGTGLPLCLAPAFDADGRLACHGPGSTDGMPIMANDRPYERPGTHRRVSLSERDVRVMGIRGYFPDFLPDGRLVYGEWLNDEADMAEYGMPPLVTSRLDGRGRRVIFRRENHQPWAPSACDDGSWIAFNEGPTFAPADEDVDIWKVRPDGTGAVNLTPDSDDNDAFPAWSPDCGTIAFRSGRDGDKEIYLMDADGGDVRRITHREGVETVPDISPDGEWIAFATDRDGAGLKIWLQRLDGSEGRFLEPDRAGEPGIDMHPRFSPDGEWIAFVSDRGGMADEFLLTDDPQPYGDIWAVPVDGGEAVRLTDDKWEDGLPRWEIPGRR